MAKKELEFEIRPNVWTSGHIVNNIAFDFYGNNIATYQNTSNGGHIVKCKKLCSIPKEHSGASFNRRWDGHSLKPIYSKSTNIIYVLIFQDNPEPKYELYKYYVNSDQFDYDDIIPFPNHQYESEWREDDELCFLQYTQCYDPNREIIYYIALSDRNILSFNIKTQTWNVSQKAMYGSNIIGSNVVSSCYIPNKNEIHTSSECVHYKLNLNDNKVDKIGGWRLVNFAKFVYIESLNKLLAFPAMSISETTLLDDCDRKNIYQFDFVTSKWEKFLTLNHSMTTNPQIITAFDYLIFVPVWIYTQDTQIIIIIDALQEKIYTAHKQL